MISTTAKHAVRALAHLASLPEGESLGGRDLARAANIPQNYLSKILWALGSARIIDATRGTGGGYRLHRPAEAIRLIEIVDLFDKARTATDCFMDGAHPCSDATGCAAHSAWREIKHAYVTFLETTTLATLASRGIASMATEVRP